MLNMSGTTPVDKNRGQKAFLPCPVTGHFEPMTLAGDKSEAWGCEKVASEATLMMLIEVGFPSLHPETVRRNLILKWAGDRRMVQAECCFPRDTGFCQVFIPKDVVVNFELLDFDKDNNEKKRSGAIFSNVKAAMIPLEATPLTLLLLGNCIVHHNKKAEATEKETDPGKPNVHTNVPPGPVPPVKPVAHTPEGAKPPIAPHGPGVGPGHKS